MSLHLGIYGLLPVLAGAVIVAGSLLLSQRIDHHAAAAAIFTVTTVGDEGDFDTSDGVCDIDDSSGDGPCTLRAALQQANASEGYDTIAFNISGSGPHTIQPSTALPVITDPVTIDGYTQPGASPNTNDLEDGTNAVLAVELDGSSAGTTAEGLSIRGGSSTVRGLAIHDFRRGIYLNTAGGNIIQGNFIGTDASGTIASGNLFGIDAGNHSALNLIGGPTPAATNLISGNDSDGIAIAGDENTIQRNLIGLDRTGTLDVGNGNYGVSIDNEESMSILANRIAFNGLNGIVVFNISNDHLIAGNTVTMNKRRGISFSGGASGALVIDNLVAENAWDGLALFEASNNAVIGNVIHSNGLAGINLDQTAGTTFQGNYIGTDPTGAPLGNGSHGIWLFRDSSNNAIGSLDIADSNTIAFNQGAGVFVSASFGGPSTATAVLSNSIHSNAGLGIELGPAGVTPNDPGDGDAGDNGLQNFPVLSSAISGPPGTAISGTLDSIENQTFILQFFASSSCDPSGFGEGASYLGSTNVATDDNGDAGFTAIVTTTVPSGQAVTATATDSSGNTSEFSECEEVLPDADGDWVADGSDNCPSDPNPGQEDAIHPNGIGDHCDDPDGDGRADYFDGCPDTFTVWPTPLGDGDCDGFSDIEEAFIGTDQSDACPDDPDDDAWPADLASGLAAPDGGYGKHDGVVNILDLLTLTPPAFNTSPPNPNYAVRKDLDGSGTINILDVVRLTPPMFNESCAP